MEGFLWFVLLCVLITLFIWRIIDNKYPPRCSDCRKEGYYWCFHNRAYRFEWSK